MVKARKYHIILRQIRLKSGLTQSQVANYISETQSYISKYENGEQRLDLYEIEKICGALGISLPKFMELYYETE